MQIRRWLLLSCLAALAVAPACSGDDDDDGSGPSGNGDLATGQYEVTTATAGTDECAVGDPVGAILDIAVTGETIDVNGATGDYNEGAFDATLSEAIDLNDDPFGAGPMDCTFDLVNAYAGATTAENEADLDYTFAVENPQGPECATAATTFGIPFPCTSEVAMHIVSYTPPPPVTGTLSLVATGGQLTLVGDQAPDSGFTLSGDVDGTAFTEISDNWTCYAPDLPTFPNYDLFIGGADYFVSLSFTTAQWISGNVIPLTNLPDQGFDTPTASTLFVSGDVEVVAAPLVIDSAFRCAVSIDTADFEEPPAFAPRATKSLSPADAWKTQFTRGRR